MNVNNEITFNELLSELRHGIKKSPEVHYNLADRLGSFELFCNSVGRLDSAQILKELKRALLCHCVDEIQEAVDHFCQHVADAGLGKIEPTFMNFEIWMYRKDQFKVGILFGRHNQVIMRAIDALLKCQFGFSRLSKAHFVKGLSGEVTVVCDSRNGSILHAAKVPNKRCLVVDFETPEACCFDNFIKLPMTIEGYESLCKCLTIQ